ncbi:hypothetical protein KFE26_14940 [Shewanella sp. M16]|uniref:hypothetical protein n=1 Tax=Shewanella sp. M16 TaxID=2830837 RepID=UPI001BB08FD1|nr:hypothetical protein [Shewanella sp. M16]MBS0043583.1 hypothetical protein [Shewanella sp. M16]
MLLVISIAVADSVLSHDYVVGRTLKTIVYLSICYVVIELLFNSHFHQLVFSLYKREFRYELLFYGVTFFGTSYYSGYAFLIVFYLCLINYSLNKVMVNFLLILCSAALVILSQSKTIILALFLSTYLYLIIVNKNYIFRLLLLSAPVTLLFIFIANKGFLSDILVSSGLRSAKSLDTLLMNTSNSGTLNVRMDQILYAFDIAYFQSYIFGAGLGRAEDLESLPAVFLYRYGLIGLAFHYIMVFIALFYSAYKIYVLRNSHYRIYALVVFLWLITLPITQLSGVMIEMSKLSYLSAIMVGYLMRLKFINVK